VKMSCSIPPLHRIAHLGYCAFMHECMPTQSPAVCICVPAHPPVIADRAWRLGFRMWSLRAAVQNREGHGAPNLRSGLPHSPPEAEDGLVESEEEVEPLSVSSAAAAATSAVLAAAVAAFLAHLVQPNPALSLSTKIAPF
jgi:hypothetical protein